MTVSGEGLYFWDLFEDFTSSSAGTISTTLEIRELSVRRYTCLRAKPYHLTESSQMINRRYPSTSLPNVPVQRRRVRWSCFDGQQCCLENKRHDYEKGIIRINSQLGKDNSSPP